MITNLYSEIEASIISKSYTVIKGSVNICCAFAEVQLNKLWEKIESNLSFLDLNTDGGQSLILTQGRFRRILVN